jgi:hypothetical protein
LHTTNKHVFNQNFPKTTWIINKKFNKQRLEKKNSQQKKKLETLDLHEATSGTAYWPTLNLTKP